MLEWDAGVKEVGDKGREGKGTGVFVQDGGKTTSALRGDRRGP